MKKKGQLSAEFLLLFLIFLFMLSVSLYSLSRLQLYAGEEIKKASMKRLVERIAYKIKEVCILGEGNVRVLREEGISDFELIKDRDILKLKSGTSEAEMKAECGFEILDRIYKGGSVLVEMRDGMVRIREPK
ncbi:MAG: class III signal peptide-containing protein [Candidatus Anstonellales archaeon]